MKKIYILGASGSGKSTLARKLSELLRVPRFDLDEAYWQEGKEWIPNAEGTFIDKIKDIIGKDSWIVEGAQDEAKKLITPAADTLVWVDPGMMRIFNQLCSRTYQRIKTQETFCNGKTESLGNTLSANSIFLWATRTYLENKQTLGAVFSDTAKPKELEHLNLIHLNSRKEVNAFLSNLPLIK